MTDTKKTILLVEDNPDDEAMTLRALARDGIANGVVVARDGVEALDDLKLPRIDGLDVLRRLCADPRTASLPVVVLTSSTEPTDVAGSYDQFANSCIRRTGGLHGGCSQAGPVRVDSQRATI
jgi:two-component system, response regulator